MKGWILALGLTIVSGTAGAEPLTLADCLRQAREHSPELAGARGRWLSDSGQAQESRGLRLPQLSATASYQYTSRLAAIDLASRLPAPMRAALSGMAPLTFGDHDSALLGVQISQPIFTGLTLSANQQAAALREESSRLRLEEMGLAVEERASLLYYNLGRAGLLLQAANTSLRQRQAHERDVENFLAAGQITRDELLKAQLARLEAEERVQNTDAALRLAQLDLALAMGIDTAQAPRLQVAPAATLPPQPQLFAGQLPRRPESQARRAEVAAAAAGERAARGAYYPSLSGFAGYNYGRPGVDPFRNQWMGYGVAGARLQWDFFNFGQTAGRVAKQRGLQLLSAAEEARFQRDLIQQVEAARVEVENAFTRARLRRQALETAREQLRMVSDLFRQGQKSNTDYLDAEESANRAEIEGIDSETAYRMALARLRRALGRSAEDKSGEDS